MCKDEDTMSTALAHPGGPHTLADWESLDHDSDGNRVELIGGHLHVTPAPGFTHQIFSDELRFELRQALREYDRHDLVAVSAIGVAVTEEMGFIPDIVVAPVPADGAVKISAADTLLAVEIVSPRTRKSDRLTKPAAYAEAGVPYYWRVEPIPGDAPTIVCFELVDGEYAKRHVVESEAPVAVKAAPVPVELDVDALYGRIFGRQR